MSYKYVLFDFDGTLADTSEGILAAVRYAQEKLKLEDLTQEHMQSFIGPPLKRSFAAHYKMDDEEAESAVKVFREYYAREGVYQCELYAYVPDVLRELCSQGLVLYVATSKPTKYAQEIADRLHIAEFFEEIVGSNLDNTRDKKREIIQYILDKNKHVPLTDFVMIGDTYNDVNGAKICGIDSIGVTYGFGAEKDLQGARKIVSDIREIPRICKE